MTFQAMRTLRDQRKLTADQWNPFLKPRPEEELYDLETDPHELRILIDSTEHAFEFRDLRNTLREWERRTKDVVPKKRRPDEFDQETGDRLTKFRKPRKSRQRK